MAKSKTAAAKAATPKPARAAEQAPPVTCATCPYLSSKPTLAGTVCKRFPTAILKRPDDWCGEHPDFDTGRS